MIPRQAIRPTLTLSLFVVLLTNSTQHINVDAYVSSTISFAPSSILPNNIQQQIRTIPKHEGSDIDNNVDQVAVVSSSSSSSSSSQPNGTMKVSYDLGIIPQTSSTKISTIDVSLATRYLVEHESVNEFPSPLLQQQQNNNDALALRTTKKPKIHPPLIPHRVTDDNVLKIIQKDQNIDDKQEQLNTGFHTKYIHKNSDVQAIVHPTMRSGKDFDINTAWIELLIHEQQTKLQQQQQQQSTFGVVIAKPAFV